MSDVLAPTKSMTEEATTGILVVAVEVLRKQAICSYSWESGSFQIRRSRTLPACGIVLEVKPIGLSKIQVFFYHNKAVNAAVKMEVNSKIRKSPLYPGLELEYIFVPTNLQRLWRFIFGRESQEDGNQSGSRAAFGFKNR